MARSTTTIDLSGPFFTKDPRKTFRPNARVMLKAIEEEGEADVRAQLRAGESGRVPISHGVTPNRVSAHVVGRVASLTGKPWQVTAVVSVNNSGFSRQEGIALMAAASRVERETHAFRKTTNRLRRSRKANAAELLKGLT
jgi:hypothetical protein